MKQVLISLSLLFLQIGMNAQSLIDEELQRIVAGALAEEISHCPEVRYAGVVVQQVSTGNVVADISLNYRDGEFKRNPLGNAQFVPNGLGRSVLYLCVAMMSEFNPYKIVFDTFDGAYVDADGDTIKDHNYHRGGYGLLQVKRGFAVNSDVCLLRCAEKVFKKNMKTFAKALNKSGILFGGRVSEDLDKRWNSREILGSSPMSLLQMACWCNAVAGGKLLIRMNENDSTIPYDSISSSKEALDSLRSAMRECVTNGLARKLNSEYFSVAGITNVSPKGVDGFKGQFAACYLPYEESEPKYTIACYIWRADRGYCNPSIVLRKIIDWIAFNRLNTHPYFSGFSDSQVIKHSIGWVHPGAR